jgi:hypothetical protein
LTRLFFHHLHIVSPTKKKSTATPKELQLNRVSKQRKMSTLTPQRRLLRCKDVRTHTDAVLRQGIICADLNENNIRQMLQLPPLLFKPSLPNTTTTVTHAFSVS